MSLFQQQIYEEYQQKYCWSQRDIPEGLVSVFSDGYDAAKITIIDAQKRKPIEQDEIYEALFFRTPEEQETASGTSRKEEAVNIRKSFTKLQLQFVRRYVQLSARAKYFLMTMAGQ